MSKTTTGADPYVAYAFVTADEIVAHFGITGGVASLPSSEQQRYNNYALIANRATETTIYKYVDNLPLDTSDEANTYAKSMAFHHALWQKAADDGANNVASLKTVWETDKEQLIQTLQAQPKQATTRTMVSRSFNDDVPPYSQSYGLSQYL